MYGKTITVYQTHIEVQPYRKGEHFGLEDQLSVFDPIYYKRTPIGFYIDELTNILYLPRGINITMLENIFNTKSIISRKCVESKFIRIKEKLEPRDRIQSDAVDFLCSRDRFIKGLDYNQLSLNLAPGDGKTIATILSICQHYRCVTTIIVHQTSIKEQWKEEFLKASNIKADKIIDVIGSDMVQKVIKGELSGYIYIMTHQTIHEFCEIHGWENLNKFFQKIKCGLKVYDEAHKYFSNILKCDFFSDVQKTIYLTATFTRTQQQEKKIFKTAFSTAYRFGEETLQYEEKRKHTIYYMVKYNSEPDPLIIPPMYNKFTISPFRYIEYCLIHDENRTMYKMLDIIMDEIINLRGKVLIISPMIKSSELIADHLARNYREKTVSVINSSKSQADNEMASQADIISSTIKSMGTGIDLKGLRVLINLEPFTSADSMNQLRGRLREYGPDDDTFMFDVMDVGFKDIERMGGKRKAAVKKLVKEIKIFNY